MKKHNFTLIEIMGVAALLVILFVIGVGVYTYAVHSSKEKATKATITRLNSALQMVQDKGLMPRVSSYSTVTVNVSGRSVSFGGSSSADPADAYKYFMQAMDADNINSILVNNVISDGWGQPILIRYPGVFNRGSFDIISPGSDGGFGENAASAPPTAIISYKDGNDLICDDVANFL